MSTSTKPAAKVYVVLQGYIQESPEEVEIRGVFLREEDAYEFRNADYREANGIDEDDEEYMGPDLNSSFVDDGQCFWSVIEQELR